MNEYSKEQFEQMPEFMQSEYTLDGETYKHAGVVKMKGTLNDLNGKLETQKDEYTSLNERLTGFESSKAADIQAATDKALEKAHKENDIDAILKIEREKLADQQTRFDESSGAFDLRMKEIAGNQKKNAAQALTNELATDKGKKAFNRLIESYISVDPATGLETYLNDDGSASSLNREQFIGEIAKNELFSTLVKANINVTGGGGMNGSDGSGAPTGTPSTLEECKGDRKLEAAYFNKQMTG
jgi:hypothetical protein